MSQLPGVGSGTGLNRMFAGSEGMQTARMLERLGLPPDLANQAGLQVDSQKGDLAGVQRLMMAATQGLSAGQADSLFGKGLPPAHFVPRPHHALAAAASAATFAMNPGMALSRTMAEQIIGRGFSPFGGAGGVSREAPFGTGREGRSLERAMRRDPMFKAQMERMLGGTILPDHRNDGKLTIYRPPFSQVGNLMREALGAGTLPRMGLAAALGGMALPLGGALMANAMTGGIMRGLMRSEANIVSFMKDLSGDHVGAQRSKLLGDPEARQMATGMGIDLRNASFEDILFLLLMKYAKKKEDDILKKVQQLDKSMQGGNKGGGIMDMVGGALSTVGSVAGFAFGGPIGAAAGGFVGSLAGGALSSMGQNGTASGGGMTGSELGEKMDASKMSDTMKQQMLQKLMGDLQKLYEMLSNMIKSMHDMQMTPVRNLRG